MKKYLNTTLKFFNGIINQDSYSINEKPAKLPKEEHAKK